MKLVVRVKLVAAPEVAAALRATLFRCNEQANRISAAAHRTGNRSRKAMQAAAYVELKDAGLSAQPALHVIRKVADAYTVRKESRRVTDTNHVVSKRIVTEAQRTAAGIGLEDLSGIRQRARLRRPQRVTLHSWAFAQLGSFIKYKARLAGVPLVYVDPAYTSQECSDCHYTDRRNRPNQATFACRSCGVVAHADRNASRNIAHRAAVAWNAGRPSSAPVPAQ